MMISWIKIEEVTSNMIISIIMMHLFCHEVKYSRRNLKRTGCKNGQSASVTWWFWLSFLEKVLAAGNYRKRHHSKYVSDPIVFMAFKMDNRKKVMFKF